MRAVAAAFTSSLVLVGPASGGSTTPSPANVADLRAAAVQCSPADVRIAGLPDSAWTPQPIIASFRRFLPKVGGAPVAPTEIEIISYDGFVPGHVGAWVARRGEDGGWRVAWPAGRHTAAVALKPDQALQLDRLVADDCLFASPALYEPATCFDGPITWITVRVPTRAWYGRRGCVYTGPIEEVMTVITSAGVETPPPATR